MSSRFVFDRILKKTTKETKNERHSLTSKHKITPVELFTPLEFFTLASADGSSLEFECQQVSSSLQALLSILTILNNVVVSVVSTRPLIFLHSLK